MLISLCAPRASSASAAVSALRKHSTGKLSNEAAGGRVSTFRVEAVNHVAVLFVHDAAFDFERGREFATF